jgi:hypothetical protein
MSAEFSRRGAWVVRDVFLPNNSYLDFSFAVEAAESVEDLPDWAREALLDAEARIGVSPYAYN